MICVINKKQKQKTHWTNWSIREIRPCSVRDGDENFFCSSSDNWASLPAVEDTFTTLQKKKHKHNINPPCIKTGKNLPTSHQGNQQAKHALWVLNKNTISIVTQFKWGECKHDSASNTRKTEKFWSCYWPCSNWAGDWVWIFKINWIEKWGPSP